MLPENYRLTHFWEQTIPVMRIVCIVFLNVTYIGHIVQVLLQLPLFT